MNSALHKKIPVEKGNMAEEEKVSRRRFGAAVIWGSVAAAVAALWGLRKYLHASDDSAVLIAQTNSLAPDSFLIFQYPTPEAPCLLIRKRDGSYVAFSRICTHAGCPVFFHPENNDIECPCHGGVYSVENGSVLEGPPPRPLPQIHLEIRGNNIYAQGIVQG